MAIAHPSGQLHEPVWTALNTFDEHPNAEQDEILTALVDEAGLLSEAAWALFQIVPAAVTHTVFRPQGVNFPTHFLDVQDLSNIDGAKRRAWTEDPYYVTATEVVEHLLAENIGTSVLASAASHSSELNCFSQLAEAGCDPSEIGFSDPLVVSYAALEQATEDEGV